MTKEKVLNQDFEAQVSEEEKKSNLWQKLKSPASLLKKLPPFFNRNKKLVFIGAGLIILLIILVTIIVFVSRNQRDAQSKQPALPSPSPSPFEEEIINPSAYATDSAVLEIEKRLREIDQDLGKTDLKETSLNLPVLDMEVNFEE